MVSLIFKLAIASVAIKLLVTATALPAAANPPKNTPPLTPAHGKCVDVKNTFARVNQSTVSSLSKQAVGTTALALGIPFCYISADPAYPNALRAAWPIIGSSSVLVVYFDSTGGAFLGYGLMRWRAK